MNLGHRAILGLCVLCLLAWASPVRADLAGPRIDAAGSPAAPAGLQQSARRSATPLAQDLTGITGPVLPRLLETAPAARNDEPYAGALPPEPSSAGLFLAALGSAFAWQAGRSAKKIHLAAIPHWYHAGGPGQVGHITPLNPDLSAPDALLSHFDELVQQTEKRFGRCVELVLPIHLQTHRWIEPTRGPPVLSF